MKLLIGILIFAWTQFSLAAIANKELSFSNFKIILPVNTIVSPLPSVSGYFVSNDNYTATISVKDSVFKNFNLELANSIWKRNLHSGFKEGKNLGCKNKEQMILCQFQMTESISSMFFVPYQIITLVQTSKLKAGKVDTLKIVVNK